MTCASRIAELVECARGHAVPGRELRAHLDSCADCRQRWDAEQLLTEHLGVIRIRTGALKSPASRREALMQEFARRHQQRVTPGRPTLVRSLPAWGWTFAAAAAVLLAVLIGHQAGLRSRHFVAPAARTHAVHSGGAVLYEVSTDASELSNDDFVAVPYTPPLAAGEMVRMVHTDMYPEALTSLGVAVDPAWAGNLPVDMVVGEDGLPRAVRISDNGPN